MDFGDDDFASKDDVDPAAEFLAREQSVLGELEAEILPAASSIGAPVAAAVVNDDSLLGGGLNGVDGPAADLAVPNIGSGLESSTESHNDLESKLTAVHITSNEKRTNYLSWDDYFMATALLAAKRSKDPVTQVGACIVDADYCIVAIGYNGFPRNCSDDIFPWGKQPQAIDHQAINLLEDKRMYVVHAEANAILNKNTANLKGTRLYATLFPCNECAKLIIQSGIVEVLFISNKYHSKPAYRASRRMFDAAGVRYRRYLPSQSRLIIDFEEHIGNEES